MDSSSEDEDGVTVSTNKVAIAIESSDSSSDDSPPPSSGEQQEAVQDEEKQAHAKKRRRSTSWTQDAAAAAAPAAAEGTETGLDEESTMKLAGTWYNFFPLKQRLHQKKKVWCSFLRVLG